MPARKSYDYGYYESGTAARKLEYAEKKTKNINKATGTKKVPQINKKSKTSTIVMILCIFSMALVLVYRYNVINEKNLQSQSLSSDLGKLESNLLTSQIEVEQNTDLNKIEAYAKQKLGMQKPDKNQTIYVDTSKTSNSVQVQDGTKFFQGVINNVTNFFSEIF